MKTMKKLAALFVAATMAMSMSISAFAEVILTEQRNDMYDAAEKELILRVDSEEEQITVMAYTVPSDTTTANIPDFDEGVHTIIALDQTAGETGFSTIPVDETKIGDSSIVVKVGGSNGDVAVYLISFTNEVISYSVVFDYGEGTGDPASKTFDDDDTVAAVLEGVEVTVPENENYTYEFLGWATTADAETPDVAADSTNLMTSLLDGNATSVTLYAIYEATPVEIPVETITVYCGDVDGDEDVDADDATYILVSTVGGKKDYSTYPIGSIIANIEGFDLVSGDVDGDGDVDADDATYVLVSTVGGKKDYSKFPIGGKVTFDVPKTQE